MSYTRREWLAGAGFAALSRAAGPGFVKSICSVIFPPGTAIPAMFRQAKAAGFDAIELRLGVDIAMESAAPDLTSIRDSARAEGMQIASLWVSQPLSQNPLNSPDAAARAKGVAAIRRAAEIAAAVNCGALLLVPGRVGAGAKLYAGYEDTWQRFTGELAKCLDAGERNKVLLTIENVWNKFLMSPLEMRSFVDQFHSAWLAAHFDTGNVMQFGYPEDWIRTLGPRIRRVHLKDFRQGRFVPLLQGDVNFPAVINAFHQVGYHGFLSPEIDYDPSQPNQLEAVANQVSAIVG